jgi:hypothetical protein
MFGQSWLIGFPCQGEGSERSKITIEIHLWDLSWFPPQLPTWPTAAKK